MPEVVDTPLPEVVDRPLLEVVDIPLLVAEGSPDLEGDTPGSGPEGTGAVKRKSQ